MLRSLHNRGGHARLGINKTSATCDQIRDDRGPIPARLTPDRAARDGPRGGRNISPCTGKMGTVRRRFTSMIRAGDHSQSMSRDVADRAGLDVGVQPRNTIYSSPVSPQAVRICVGGAQQVPYTTFLR